MNRRSVSQFERMTTTPVHKLVARLAVPTVLSMLITSIYNLADTAFVGMIGTSASAAVGVVFGFMSIIQAVGFMFGQGSGSIISRLLGARNDEEATRTASTTFFLSLSIGVIFAVLGLLFRSRLVMTLGSTATIAPYARTYITYILLACPFTMTSFVLNNILRFEGKAALGMAGMMTGGILNIVLDPLFIFVFKMGIGGAGLATGLSQFIGFMIQLFMFLSGRTQVKLSIRKITLAPVFIGNICATGLPSLLRQGLTSLATVLLNSQAAIYGDEAVAALSIVNRIIFLIFSVGIGIGQGFQPVCGFNYGARRYDRVKDAFRFTCMLAQVIITGAAIVMFLVSNNLIQLFRNDPAVIEIGTRALRLQCIALFFTPGSMITEMLFQSTGHKVGASVLSSLRSGGFFIPAVLILPAVRGLAGLQEAQPLSFILAFIPAVIMAAWFFRHLPQKDAH
ncbi:MAG: MATE family efflux transporter [Eubacterium sp.]|nr:MATE family efflux transporter [Eubacterium sp.]